MEEQNKYYIPESEELFLGYQCEFNEQENWETFTIYDRSTLFIILRDMEINEESPIRTKYLDQSDIESCGWVKDWDENSNYTGCYKLLVKSDINGQSDDNWELWQYGKIVSISNELGNRCFDGECKSINELRKIMQWLYIK